MRLFVLAFFPLITSLIWYVVSVFFAFDYCRGVKEWAIYFKYSGVEYLSSSPLGCIVHGSLISILVFVFPYSVYMYRCMDVKKFRNTGRKLDINKTLLVSVFIFSVYASMFLSPIASYSSRGSASVDLVFGNYLLFYMFLVCPCQFLLGLWMMCLKLKLYSSK